MRRVYLAGFAVVLFVAAGDVAQWYMQLLTSQASGHPVTPTALPSGFGLTVALSVLFGMWLMGVYAISLGQVALAGRSVFGAIGDGMLGSFKNVLPLLVFALTLLVAWIVVALGIFILAACIALVGSLLGNWAVAVLMVPLYVALMLVVFVVMFGAMYHLWRDVCIDADVPAAPEAVAA